MNIPHLDLDGLDGILPAVKKQPFISKHLRPIAFFVLLVAAALIVFWLTNNGHVSQQADDVSKHKKLNYRKTGAVLDVLDSKDPVILEKSPTQLSNRQINEQIVTVPEPEELIEKYIDLQVNESEKEVFKTEVDAKYHQPDSLDKPILTSVDYNQKKTAVAEVISVVPFIFLFDFDSSTVKPLLNDNKERLTEFIDQCNNKISIVGHTCNRGSAISNRQLGMARANKVFQFLIELGVNANFLSTHSEGMDKPVSTNATWAGRRLNRRVEIHCNRD